MKLDTFEVRTKSQLLPDYTNHSEIINSFGRELLREEMIAHKSNPSNNNKPLTLRLMGKYVHVRHYINMIITIRSEQTPPKKQQFLTVCCEQLL
ncbi:unnamed protein product [Trichobilharzia regenti]|nr:unnamed protein product [Trichobilharzia regenti]